MYWKLISTLFIIDICSKILAEKKLKFHPSAVFKGSVYLCYVRNFGIAFNKLNHRKGLILSLNFILLWYIASFETVPGINRLGISMIFAGGLGNTVNRLIRGYVIDFIHFNINGSPVFNLADFYIFIGAIMLVAEEIANI